MCWLHWRVSLPLSRWDGMLVRHIICWAAMQWVLLNAWYWHCNMCWLHWRVSEPLSRWDGEIVCSESYWAPGTVPNLATGDLLGMVMLSIFYIFICLLLLLLLLVVFLVNAHLFVFFTCVNLCEGVRITRN